MGSFVARTRTSWLGRSGVIAALVVFLLGVGLPAYAEGPVDLGGKRVVDHSGALGDAGVEQAAKATDGTGLYSVYVDSFDGDDPTQWCIRTAKKSGLDARAVLLVVATGERTFDLCAGSDVDLDGDQRRAIGAAARGELAHDNWVGATEAAAAELKAQTGDTPVENAESAPEPAYSSFGFPFGTMIFLAVVGVIAVIVYRVATAKRRAATGQGVSAKNQGAPVSVEDATARVVQVDDLVRQAREDLDFASAELGHSQVAPFTQTLRQAEALRDQAWQVIRSAGQTTDPRQRTQLAEQAVTLAESAARLIAEQTEAFEAARDTQQRAGDDLVNQALVVRDIRRDVEAARAELARLHHDFPHTSFTSLDDNPDQAERLLESAEHTLSEGQQAWKGADREGAIGKLTLAQRAITQARAQIQQVMEARETLGDVNRALLREISALGTDLDDAARLAANSQAVAPLVAEAKAAIADAEAARAGRGDPLAAMARMTEANAAIDEVLDPLRDAEVSSRKAQAAVEGRIGGVERRVQETEAYISSHRGAVGAVARERANQARALVADARERAQADPRAAEQALREAEALASQALAIAQQDVATRMHDDDDMMGFGRGPMSRPGGVDVGSLMLGGLLFGGLGGNHSSHHDSSWGGISTGGFGGFGGGGFSGGSFGGGGGFSGGFGGGSF